MGFPSEIPQGLVMFGWATLTWPGKKWSHAGFPRKFVGKNSYPRKYWQYVDKRAGIFVIKEKSWRILNVIPSYLFELSRDVGPDVLADAGDTWKIFLEWGWERARRVWIHWQRDQRDPWQDQCQGAANPGWGIVPCWVGLCKAEHGIPTSEGRDHIHGLLKTQEQTLENSWIPKFQNSFDKFPISWRCPDVISKPHKSSSSRVPLEPHFSLPTRRSRLSFSGLELVADLIPDSLIPGTAEFSSQGLFCDAAIPG